MVITGVINNLQFSCGLAGLQIDGASQYYEPIILSHVGPLQLGGSSQSSGLAARCLSCDKSQLRSVILDLDQYGQARSLKTQSWCRKLGILRSIEATPSGSLRYRAVKSETTASTTATETPQEHQNSNSENSPEDGKQGVGVSSGLSALDAYFSKLNGSTDTSEIPGSASSFTQVSTVILPDPKKQAGTIASSSGYSPSSVKDEKKEVTGLKALDAYFDKLKSKKPGREPQPFQEDVKPVTENATELTDEEKFMKSLMDAKEDYERYQLTIRDQGSTPTSDLKFQVNANSEMDFQNWDFPDEQTGSSNLINVLVAINVAVYLFGLASPHEALGITDSSLPIVYGAKVNELILSGQWWRLITPMFLHASLLHVGLGSWALLSFGPAVESAYGTLGFSMIYFLGGLFGDLTSFFHTTEWTVGGTGPIYALVGTWVVYLLKNREIIGKDIADDMIRKVVILSAVNVALCNSLPIDDWTHLGALLIGTLFGILASPTMHLNVALKETSQNKEDEEAAAYLWFNDDASPARLALVFGLCLGIFFILFQLSVSGSNDFYLMQDLDEFSRLQQ